jgi:hypothetical protein
VVFVASNIKEVRDTRPSGINTSIYKLIYHRITNKLYIYFDIDIYLFIYLFTAIGFPAGGNGR